jgi:hypothetical protein
MNKKLAIALAIGILSFAAAMTPFVYAQPLSPADESETETEQEIRQKNVCSGWAICTNIAAQD